jgi:hypothetical protein
MCLRVNKGGGTPPERVRGDEDAIEELKMREPPGYLGTIVRRIKRRALMERDVQRQAEARRMRTPSASRSAMAG